MKDQKELYSALDKVDHIYDASGLDQTISDISGNICTIAEVAQQGLMNHKFAESLQRCLTNRLRTLETSAETSEKRSSTA